MADDKKRRDRTAGETEPPQELRLDKETLENLEPQNSEQVKGGGTKIRSTE